MRSLLPFALLLSGAAAQSVLTTAYDGRNWLASLDGGVYFDLSVQRELHVDALDLNLISPAGTTGIVDVFVRPATWVGHVGGRGDWVLAASGPVTALGPRRASPCMLSAPVGLPPGDYGVALHLRGVLPIYGSASAPVAFANADLRLVAGGSAVHFLAGEPFAPRIWNGALHYDLGGGPYTVASAEPFGAGCTQGARSFYEAFAPGAFDLARRRIALAPNGVGGWDATVAAAAPIALPPGAVNLGLQPGGAAFVQLAAPLSHPGGATSTVLVHADGRVLLTDLGAVGTSAIAPAAAELFAGVPMFAVAWSDLAPTSAQNVFAAVDAASGATTIVWWQVPSAAAAGDSTFAITFHGDGRVELAFDNVASSSPTVVGYSAGRGARDPGPRDLDAAPSFATQGDDDGLGLVAEGRPVLGTTTTLRLVDVPAAATVAAIALGVGPLVPALALDAFGAPGCSLHVAPAGATWIGQGVGDVLAIAVPARPSWLGLQFAAQAAVLAPGANALGVLTSNGLRLGVGGV